MEKTNIAIAEGDGIGPEIMAATLHVLEEAGANLDYHKVEIGEKCIVSGVESGISPLTWDTLCNTAALLKGPTTSHPVGYPSISSSIISKLELYANICPCASYAPLLPTKHPKMDLVLISENFNTHLEYRQTPETWEVTKLASRPQMEKVIRLAFEYARNHRRKKGACFTKDNTLKLSDGLFHQIFDEISVEYSDIVNEHWLANVGAAKLASSPQIFDLILLPNCYGDIFAALAAQLSGSPTVVPSANIGDCRAMFEALHGAAAKHAGQNRANPSGLLLAAVMMLNHLGLHEVAERIHNAWLKTIEEGIHTYDLYQEGVSRQRVGTKEFANTVAKFLGQKPQKLKAASYQCPEKLIALDSSAPKTEKRTLIGVDIFLHSKIAPDALQSKLASFTAPLTLELLSNEGRKIWLEGRFGISCIDQFQARFANKQKRQGISPDAIIKTIQALLDEGFDVIKTENLYLYDGEPGFSNWIY